MKYFKLIFFILAFYACQDKNQISDNEIIVPDDVHTLIKINQKDEFLKRASANSFFKGYFGNIISKNAKDLLEHLPVKKDIYLAYSQNQSYCITLIDSVLIKESFLGKANDKVSQFAVNHQNWYYVRDGNRLILSSHDSISNFSKNIKKEKTTKLYDLYKNTDKEALASVFFNYERTKNVFSPLFSNNPFLSFGQWSLWDIFLDKDEIRLSGTALNDLHSDGVSSLSTTISSDFKTDHLIPEQSTNLRLYNFNAPEDLESIIEVETDFLEEVSEIGYFNLMQDTLCVVSSKNIEQTYTQLIVNQEEFYNDVRIFSLEENDEILRINQNFNESFSPLFGAVINHCIFFSKEKKILTKVINLVQTNSVFANSTQYKHLNSKLPTQSSYKNIEFLQKNIFFNKNYPSLASKYQIVALQITPKEDFFVYSMVASPFSGQNTSTETEKNFFLKEKYHFTLDAEARTPPKWVMNHNTKRKEIIIQDVESNLYLFDNQGKRLWKKQLDSPVNGQIFQVDLFRNEKLQYAFNTQHTFWVIDRNGQNVSEFPKTSKDPIYPLQVFDYESDRNYRFVVSTKNKIKILDNKAQEIQGFLLKEVDGQIANTPKHFRIENKDYIVLPCRDGKILILHRNGTPRLTVNKKFEFSKNEIYVKNNQFTFTTTDSKIVSIDQNASIKEENFTLSPNHFTEQRYDIEVILSDNKLYISGKKVELPYGNYTQPHIFKVNQQILVSVCDKQANKVYLIDKDGKTLENFPIYGTSSIDMTIDQGKAQIAFLKEKNQIFVYELN